MAKGRKIIWTRGNCFQTKGCWYCFRAMRTLQCSTRTARAPLPPLLWVLTCWLTLAAFSRDLLSTAPLLSEYQTVQSPAACLKLGPIVAVSAQWIQMKLNPPVFGAQLCPTPRLISALLSSQETPENSRPQSLPRALLLETQTQDALWNNHIPSSLHRLYALLA